MNHLAYLIDRASWRRSQRACLTGYEETSSTEQSVVVIQEVLYVHTTQQA